jgi:glycosyltransferase involved in cell wall biosynthesis
VTVVHILDRVRIGHGRCLSVLDIAELQHRAGWDTRLLISDVSSPGLLRDHPPPERLFSDASRPIYRDTTMINAVASSLEHRTVPGDTIIAHHGVTLAAACLVRDRRVVGAVHSRPDDCLGYLPRALLRTIHGRTDRWVAWGVNVAARLRDWLGIDTHRITVSSQPVSLGAGPDVALDGSPVCLTVARVEPVKNHALMLAALRALAHRMPEVHWHMAGRCERSSYGDELRGLAARLQVADRVTWHGQRDDVTAMMRAADVVVLASHTEGVPRAMQEAMTVGVPTVMPAHLIGGLAHAGLPVAYSPQAPDALADAIETAVAVDRGRLHAAARAAAHHWSRERILADWAAAVGIRVAAPPGTRRRQPGPVTGAPT